MAAKVLSWLLSLVAVMTNETQSRGPFVLTPLHHLILLLYFIVCHVHLLCMLGENTTKAHGVSALLQNLTQATRLNRLQNRAKTFGIKPFALFTSRHPSGGSSPSNGDLGSTRGIPRECTPNAPDESMGRFSTILQSVRSYVADIGLSDSTGEDLL